MGPKQVLPLQFRVELGVITMMRYYRFSKAQSLEPLHQIV